MESTSPVDGDVALVSAQSCGTLWVRVSATPFVCLECYRPIDPPADIEQYSNNPSKTGQSSPTLSARTRSTWPGGNDHEGDAYICAALSRTDACYSA